MSGKKKPADEPAVELVPSEKPPGTPAAPRTTERHVDAFLRVALERCNFVRDAGSGQLFVESDRGPIPFFDRNSPGMSRVAGVVRDELERTPTAAERQDAYIVLAGRDYPERDVHAIPEPTAAELEQRRAELEQRRSELEGTARRLLELDDILVELREELKAEGFAGAGRLLIPETAFMTTYSTLLKFVPEKLHPLSMRVRAGTGVGKSFEVLSGLRYVPPVAFQVWTSAGSDRAIYYAGDDLARKVIVFPEAGELADVYSPAVTALKSLLSEGSVTHLVTTGDFSGGFSSELVTVEGPTAAIVCAAISQLDPQLESRLIAFRADDSTEQTRRIIDNRASMGAGIIPVELEYEEWHALWLLKELDAGAHGNIPFAPAIVKLIDASHVSWRRDTGQLLRLIETFAFLHSHRRERDQTGGFVATLADYENTRALLEQGLAERTQRALTATLKETLDAIPSGSGITAAQLQEQRSLSRSTINDHTRALRDNGYVEYDRRTYQYRRVWEPGAGAALPTCEQITQAIHDDPLLCVTPDSGRKSGRRAASPVTKPETPTGSPSGRVRKSGSRLPEIRDLPDGLPAGANGSVEPETGVPAGLPGGIGRVAKQGGADERAEDYL